MKYQPPQPQSYSAETAALITQLKHRIKRLEEAGDRLQMLIEEQGWWESVPQEMWRKAKEAK